MRVFTKNIKYPFFDCPGIFKKYFVFRNPTYEVGFRGYDCCYNFFMREKELIDLGRWSVDKIDSLISLSCKIKDVGRRIAFISSQFRELDYKTSTLIGDIYTPERLVINLKEVDCFTFLDYVEAMRVSNSFSDFKENLKKIRYKSGMIDFLNRKHFFTDWIDFNSVYVIDVTEQIGGHKTVIVEKFLNLKEDGSYFLAGIKPIRREIRYIPSQFVDEDLINGFRTGDYAGIYSDKKGLDVSHVGIIIKENNNIYFRHASFLAKKVLDNDFRRYIVDKPGLIILRPIG